MNSKKVIGCRINTALALKNMKQKELAQKLGVTDNTISYFCNGERVPNTLQLIEISKILDVSADYLLGLSSESTTDKELSAVCEYTGLSEKSVLALQEFKADNKATWYMDVTNALIESENFDFLIFFLTQFATYSNQSIDFQYYRIYSHDIVETKAKSTLDDIMSELKRKFTDREDNRVRYNFKAVVQAAIMFAIRFFVTVTVGNVQRLSGVAAALAALVNLQFHTEIPGTVAIEDWAGLEIVIMDFSAPLTVPALIAQGFL